jgi:signal transduction histidine kinase
VAQARLVAPEGQKIELETLESRGVSTLLVEGDALRLEQVMMNLLSNALIYAPHSPPIAVRLRRDGNEAVVEVQDAGPGIPERDLTRIFERFYQSTSTAERPSRRGLGLGLFIAHELVAAHGGHLEVASVTAPNQGHGTTFTIHLPLAPPDASASARQELPGQEPPGYPSGGRGLAKRLRIR